MICRHCQKKKSNRPKGLCWSCYYAPGVRNLYPSTSKYAPKNDDISGPISEPKSSTDAAPGTDERIEVYLKRAEMHLCLHHEDDLREPKQKKKIYRVIEPLDEEE